MDVAFLIKEYFSGAENNVSIDVFDAKTLNEVYVNVLNVLTSHFETETSILQSLSYCFYEMLDNVHIHSGHHKLVESGDKCEIVENGLWHGTIIYMEMNPREIVDNRTDIEAEFNEPFIETKELDSLAPHSEV